MYAASKAAVEIFSDSLRREVAHFGISVSIIQPCYVATNLLRAATAHAHTNVDDPKTIIIKRMYHPFYSDFVMSLIDYCTKLAGSANEPAICVQVRVVLQISFCVLLFISVSRQHIARYFSTLPKY